MNPFAFLGKLSTTELAILAGFCLLLLSYRIRTLRDRFGGNGPFSTP
jgi:hypothetical protein